MRSKFNDFMFYFGIVLTILCILGNILSNNHLWLDVSMVGVVIFLLAVIQELRKEELNKTNKN